MYMKLFGCLDALKEPNNWIPNEFPKSWIGLINQMNNSLNSFLVLSLQQQPSLIPLSRVG
jgi:hypothetical protein